jgi:outer membrane protein TolC
MALVAPLLAGCTAASYRDDADSEVYGIIQKRRAEILGRGEGFTIVAESDSLRRQIAQSAESRPVVHLNLQKALEVAAENSRSFQAEKERVFVAALDLTLERYRLGYIPSLTNSNTMAGVGQEATEASSSLGAGLTKVLGTGARIVASIGVGIFRSLLTSDGWKSLPTTINLAITQPLLRGAGASIVEEPLTQAERDVVYAVRGFERFRHEFAVDVASRLYRILQESDTVANEKQNYDNLTKVRERNEALNQAGRLSEVEVGQARQNELTARNRWIEARESHAAQIDEFKVFLGLPVDIDLQIDEAELQTLQKTELSQVEIREDSAVAIACEKRLDYQTSQDRVADAERRTRVAADALKMGVDLKFNYGVSSPTGQASKLDFNNAAWALGLDVDFPVDRLPERNSYRLSLIALDAERRAASLATDNVRLQIRTAVRDIRQTRESYEIQKLAVALAESRVASAELFLQAGRSSTRDLLEAQQSLVEARNALTRNLVEFTLAKLALYRDLGALVVDERGIGTNDAILQAASGRGIALQPSAPPPNAEK